MTNFELQTSSFPVFAGNLLCVPTMRSDTDQVEIKSSLPRTSCMTWSKSLLSKPPLLLNHEHAAPYSGWLQGHLESLCGGWLFARNVSNPSSTSQPSLHVAHGFAEYKILHRSVLQSEHPLPLLCAFNTLNAHFVPGTVLRAGHWEGVWGDVRPCPHTWRLCVRAE